MRPSIILTTGFCAYALVAQASPFHRTRDTGQLEDPPGNGQILSLSRRLLPNRRQDATPPAVAVGDALDDGLPIFGDEDIAFTAREIDGVRNKYRNAMTMIGKVVLDPLFDYGGGEPDILSNVTASLALPTSNLSLGLTGTGLASSYMNPSALMVSSLFGSSVFSSSVYDPVSTGVSAAAAAAPSSSVWSPPPSSSVALEIAGTSVAPQDNPLHYSMTISTEESEPTSSSAAAYSPSVEASSTEPAAPASTSDSGPAPEASSNSPVESSPGRKRYFEQSASWFKRGVTSAKIQVTDFVSGSLDVLYYGDLQIGSPAQTLGVDFDTGSADLWLPVNCDNCGSKTQFKTGSSSTFKGSNTDFSISYGSGSAKGKLAQDTVTMGGLTVKNQYFGAISHESSDFAKDPNSGLIGMAFGSIASSGKTPFFENLVNAKAVAAPIFSFFLTRKQASGSQLCLGCYDSSKYSGNIVWSPVVSQTYWSLSMTGMTLDGKHNAFDQSIVGAIDTGTTLIYVPPDLAKAFYGQIPGSKQANQFGAGYYTFPCAASVKPMVSFANKAFTIDIADFNLGKTSSKSADCVGAVLAVGDGFPQNLAIVGDAFLKSWYSIFDYSNNARVGFAKSTN